MLLDAPLKNFIANEIPLILEINQRMQLAAKLDMIQEHYNTQPNNDLERSHFAMLDPHIMGLIEDWTLAEPNPEQPESKAARMRAKL